MGGNITYNVQITRAQLMFIFSLCQPELLASYLGTFLTHCEGSCFKSKHDMYENTWKCVGLELYFSPSTEGYILRAASSLNQVCEEFYLSFSSKRLH